MFASSRPSQFRIKTHRVNRYDPQTCNRTGEAARRKKAMDSLVIKKLKAALALGRAAIARLPT